jgi:hypothetical protein
MIVVKIWAYFYSVAVISFRRCSLLSANSLPERYVYPTSNPMVILIIVRSTAFVSSRCSFEPYSCLYNMLLKIEHQGLYSNIKANETNLNSETTSASSYYSLQKKFRL